MKITILTYGSRGDVQPFIPLSLGLMARGHAVRLAAPSRFSALVKETGIPFVELAGDPQELSRSLNDAGSNPIRMVRELMDHTIEIGAAVLHQVEEACRDADLIIHGFLHAVGAHTFARERNIPDVHIQAFPMFTPTGDYPNVTLPDLRLRRLNRFTHVLSREITTWAARLGYERVRRRAGLANRRLYSPFVSDSARPPTPVLCAWSPSILPPSSDWPSHVHVTGWYFSSANGIYQPPRELKTFLDSGEPPVCISFGSMVNRNVQEIDRVVRESLDQTGSRAIILSGWSQVRAPSSEKVLYLDAAPHDWLLPHCRMLVHHGGAGTTAAGLRAGIPNVVIPFMGDQSFWGRKVFACGAGPEPVPVKKLSVEKLTRAMEQAGSPAVLRRAQVIAQRIRSEDGVGTAVLLIEKHSNDSLRQHRLYSNR